MLTGKIRYRMGWRKKLVIQVEYSYGTRAIHGREVFGPHYAWRDATVEDMQAIEHGDIIAATDLTRDKQNAGKTHL